MNSSLPPTDEPRTERAHVPLSKSEKRELKRRARRQGITMNDVIRIALFPAELEEAARTMSPGERILERHEQRGESMKRNSEFRERVDRDREFEGVMEERRRRRQEQEAADE